MLKPSYECPDLCSVLSSSVPMHPGQLPCSQLARTLPSRITDPAASSFKVVTVLGRRHREEGLCMMQLDHSCHQCRYALHSSSSFSFSHAILLLCDIDRVGNLVLFSLKINFNVQKI